MTLRAKHIRFTPSLIQPNYAYYDWYDVSYGTWTSLKLTVENTLCSFVSWKNFDDDCEQTPNDAFRFGWHDVSNWNNGRLNGTPSGSSILAFNLNSWGATTVRSITAEGGRYVPNAISAGYAAAIGSTGEPLSSTSVYVDTLLCGLNSGWTLGESYFQAQVYLNWMWELHGDPFLKVYDWANPAKDMDADQDGDIDLNDFNQFSACFNGPNRLRNSSECYMFDSDGDMDIDLQDFKIFQQCFNGPNRTPKC